MRNSVAPPMVTSQENYIKNMTPGPDNNLVATSTLTTYGHVDFEEVTTDYTYADKNTDATVSNLEIHEDPSKSTKHSPDYLIGAAEQPRLITDLPNYYNNQPNYQYYYENNFDRNPGKLYQRKNYDPYVTDYKDHYQEEYKDNDEFYEYYHDSKPPDMDGTGYLKGEFDKENDEDRLGKLFDKAATKSIEIFTTTVSSLHLNDLAKRAYQLNRSLKEENLNNVIKIEQLKSKLNTQKNFLYDLKECYRAISYLQKKSRNSINVADHSPSLEFYLLGDPPDNGPGFPESYLFEPDNSQIIPDLEFENLILTDMNRISVLEIERLNSRIDQLNYIETKFQQCRLKLDLYQLRDAKLEATDFDRLVDLIVEKTLR